MLMHMRALTALALALLALADGHAAGQGPDRSQTEALARRAADRMRALRREAETLATRERTLLGDLRRLEVERDLRTEEFNLGAQELSRITAGIEAMSARIDGLQQQARLQLPDLSGRLVDLYKLGNGGYLRLLLSVDDLREMGRAYRFVSAMETLDRKRLAEHKRTLAELRRAKSELVQRQTSQALVQRDVTAARDAAAGAAGALSALIDDIDARRDLNARVVGELQVAHSRLQAAVAAMARGARDATVYVALPLRPFKGDLDWPVSGRVSLSFGRRRNARFQTAVTSNGVVINAAAGTPVQAVHEGVVAFAEPYTGFGNLVIVDHGNAAFTLYGHLAGIETPVGSRVARGQVVGSVGSLVDGTTALYFELRIDGKPVDPLQWLRKH